MKHLTLLLIIALTLSSCAKKDQNYIEIFAGSASKPALEKIAADFQKETGIEVRRSYGGSGSVLSSILISKRGDIYLPGSHDFMELALEKGIIDKSTIRVIAYLVPVVAVQKGNPLNIRKLDDFIEKNISFAIGDPRTVCVGLYGVEVFENAGLADPMREQVSTYAENCEKTATLISLQSVDAVMGWDVFGEWNREKIDIVKVDSQFVKRAAYIPAAITQYSKNRSAAEKFIEYLASEKGRDVYKDLGYIVSEEELYKKYGHLEIGGSYELHEAWK